MNAKEKKTVSRMIGIYCRAKHHQKRALCDECRQLEEYCHTRLERCPFKENKPTCKKCAIHCYQEVYKEKIREIMRFSGPRMVFYHPIEAIKHLLHGILSRL